MINKKSIIVLAAVVVVLVGAFLAVNFLWTVDEDTSTSNTTESIELFTTAKENILQMDITVDGESFAFVRTEENTWALKGNEDVRLKNSSVDYLAIDLAGIYAKQCIEENASDLGKYGLAEPFGTYTLHLSDGTDKTFYLGNQDPVTDTYYFKMADTDAVYTIYSTKGSSISKKSAEYKDSDILDVDSENLRRIYMKTNTSVLELKSEVTTVDENEQIIWTMTQPMNRECDAEPISENIISKISYITVLEFIDEADERFASSGVNNPEAVIELTDGDGISQTVYVGKAEGELRYIKTNNRVYLVSADCVSFMDVDPFLYITKFISLENITEVAKIEVTHGDVTHIATIEGEEENYTYKLDDKEVMEDTFKRQVYQKIIGLLADEFAASPVYGSPEYTVTYYMNDGSIKKNDYCTYDDRNYAAFDKDGKCEFIIRKKKLDEMFASIEDVAAGRVTEE